MKGSELYTIPPEIKEQFTEEFYQTLWDELLAIFGVRIKGIGPDTMPNIFLFTSTGGWLEALVKTCDKLRLPDVAQYYKRLVWYDSNRFDAEVGGELEKRFSRASNGDYIRACSDEKIAELLLDFGVPPENAAFKYVWDKNSELKELWMEWLAKETEYEL